MTNNPQNDMIQMTRQFFQLDPAPPDKSNVHRSEPHTIPGVPQ
jgi:hypothetical protein